MLVRMSAVAVIAGMMTVGASADEIQWTQTQNIEKGVNFPDGITGDILGIEIGDSYADAKAKLEAIKADSPPGFVKGTQAKIQEFTQEMYLPLPSGQRIEVSSPAMLQLKRDWAGNGKLAVSETINVVISAPSSGQQAHAVERLIHYNDQADQISVPDMLASLKKKFGPEPVLIHSGSETATYLWRFDNRVPVTTKPAPSSCYFSTITPVNEDDIPNLNRTGDCDAAIEVQFNFGISEKHAKSVWIKIFDTDRIKSNLTADFGFLDSYVNELRKKAAPAPKL